MHGDTWRRRQLLGAVGTAGLAGLAGCSEAFGGDQTQEFQPGIIGSGREGRELPGGTPMQEMPPLSGTLDVYSGRGQALVGSLLDYITGLYDDFEVRPRYDFSNALVNRIEQEGQNSSADVFFSVNAGSLGALADRGRAIELPDDIQELVREEFRDPEGRWVGTSGRARSIPYNTEAFDAGDIPDDIYAFPEEPRFDGVMGWTPTYGSFQAFITAMRILDGRDRARSWLEGMIDSGVQSYSDEFQIAQAVADGEISAGFTNHYYIQRVLDGRPGAPLSTAFTQNDPGAVFNVAGALVVDSTDDEELATNFVRHLLSAEAQDYFARVTFEYPLIPDVEPVGNLPTIDELNPPDGLDLSQLSDLEPTIELLREVGLSV
jgi:iron(III) transport system substrate-binding protein